MSRPRLTLSFGEALDLDLVVATVDRPSIEAVVVPQDVHRIMGDVDPIEDTHETAEEILASYGSAKRCRPGSVVVVPPRRGSPLLLQAIVYDFEESPPSREEHVFEALLSAFEEAKARGLSCLGVKPLGTAHTSLGPANFLRLLTQVCYSSAELGTSLRRVRVILMSDDELREYERLLHLLTPANNLSD
jgi:hypothetical protein